ncbi:MAG: flagellar biosynthetic protein FliO [Terriglobales bacterium]
MNPVSHVESLSPVSAKSQEFSTAEDYTRSLLLQAWSVFKWIAQRARAQQARKNLRVCESVSLGEKRFVAVVQVDAERFLIGGSSSSVSMLTRLQEAKTLSVDVEPEAGKRP